MSEKVESACARALQLENERDSLQASRLQVSFIAMTFLTKRVVFSVAAILIFSPT